MRRVVTVTPLGSMATRTTGSCPDWVPTSATAESIHEASCELGVAEGSETGLVQAATDMTAIAAAPARHARRRSALPPVMRPI